MNITDNALFYAMSDCSAMTEKERLEYKALICGELDLPLVLNLIDYIWLDNADGTRKLVLYVKKGGTDHLRVKHGISVIEMTERVIADCVVYTAKAQAKDGRTDMAVGAACIRGLSAKKLGDAFAVAQTRASRRVTLQLLGCGLLDESEIKEANDESAVMQTPAGIGTAVNQPAPVINNAPARELVPEPPQFCPDCNGIKESPQGDNGLCQSLYHGEFAYKPEIASVPAQITIEQGAVAAGAPATITIGSEEPKQRRKRRTKAEMEAARAAGVISPAGQQAAKEIQERPTPTQQTAQEALTKVPQVPAEVAPAAPTVEAAHTPTSVAAVVSAAGAPTDADLKEYKSRLANYQNNILTRNGGTMAPDEELGSVSTQIKTFFCRRAGIKDVKDWVQQTKVQWEETFKFMDDTLANSGVKTLITAITEAIRA